MDIRPVYVVQDTDSGEFLCPSADGDVGFCKFLSDAGRFEDRESAVDTAQYALDNDFIVSGFYEQVKAR